MGFMRALGKPVLGYSNDSTLFFDRAKDHLGGVDGHDEMGRPQAHGMALENFSMVDNLMLHGAVRHSGFDVIVGDVPDDELYTSLAVFEKVAELVALWPRHQLNID